MKNRSGSRVVGFVIVISAVAMGVNAQDTVGLWHMDEGESVTTTLIDSSGFGNHLVRPDPSEDVVGHPGRFGFAVGGWAHVINIGDDREGYFANTSLAGTSGLTELTFEFWLLLPASGVRNDPNPFGLGDDDDDRFRISDQGSLEYDNEGIQGTLSTGILPFGTWNHVALTWDADYARIWLNGELAAQEHSSGLTPITFLRLGGQHAGNANFSSGYVDEARLSDVVRYTSTFEPPQTPFDVAGGSDSLILADIKANGADSFVVLGQGEPLTVTAHLLADPFIVGDTWILALTSCPFPNNIFTCDLNQNSWVPWLDSLYGPSAQGAIPHLESQILLQSELPGGFYIFYLGYDRVQNRRIDFDTLEIDAVPVVIGN